uniref:Putative secreted salivary gland peptide n=1 Tax=Ixodes scapularis TaxID=6945 RepID=Q5Q998_IXOSC|nr:putative secreted salivary gland peptide [Ixodes scapularis]
MSKTGRSFSMAEKQKIIAVFLVVFVHSLQFTSAGEPIINGDFSNVSPNCEDLAKKYIKTKISDLTEATLVLRKCEFSYKRVTPSGQKYTGTYALPEGFPCAFGSTCEWGVCKCSACP